MSSSFDVAVVGGGVAGSAIAWRFAQRGLRVAVFDRADPGAASGVAGGILSAQAEAHAAGPLFELLRQAEESHRRLAVELGAERLGYRQRGVLRVATTESELVALEAERAWQRVQGLAIEGLEPAALQQLEPGLSPAIVGANLFVSGAQLDPQRLLLVLAAEGERSGVVQHAQAVTAVRAKAGKVEGVSTAEGEVDAGHVVVAAGAWSAQLAGAGFLPQAIVPVRGQMLVLSGRAPISRVVFGAGGYLVPRDQSTLIGSTMEHVGFEASATREASNALLSRARRLCPAFAGTRLAETTFGFRPSTADGLPAFGPTPLQGLHLAVGFLRNGILLAPLVADLVVAAALDGASAAAVPRPFAAARLLG